MIELNLESNTKYILTCSYGPDSMALFHLLLKYKINFVVAHVNYHILTNADDDETKLRDFCKRNNVKLFVKSMYFKEEMGNEEDVARKIRYDFFKELSASLQIPNILIAHNLDDSVETYFLQKERNNFVVYYGLNNCYSYQGINYIRPLLNYRKRELEIYCRENSVPFSIDYSNFDENYRRNYFRHSIIKKLSDKEFNEICKEMKEENLYKELERLRLSKYIDNYYIDVLKIKDLSINEFQAVIYYFMKKNNLFTALSLGFITDFYQKCLRYNKSFNEIIDEIVFECSYKKIYIYNKNVKEYAIRYEEALKPSSLIKINAKSSLFSENIIKNIVIKPIKKDDLIKIKQIYKRANRCFIDWKMPLFLREMWPGIFNELNELIYTPRYRDNYTFNDNSLLQFDIQEIFKYATSKTKQN